MTPLEHAKNWEAELSLYRDICRLSETDPEGAAFTWFSRRQCFTVSHREAAEQIEGYRTWYHSLPQARVGVLGTNSLEWIYNTWGAITVGKVTALLDPLLPVEDLTSAVRRSDLELLVVEEDLLELARQVQTMLPDLVVFGYPSPEALSESTEPISGEFKETAIFFTSGTTQNSKTVLTAVSAILGNAAQMSKLVQHEAGERILHPLPFHHSFGFAKLLMFYREGCNIFISSMKTLLMHLKNTVPDRLVLVPSGVAFLVQKNAFPKGLKSILVAGSFFSKELAAQARSFGLVVQNEYGSSEIPCGIGANLPQDDVDAITPSAASIVQIARDGEILVDTPFHFTEYYQNPEDTMLVCSGDRIFTGDMGYLDEAGRLHLQGRKKNMILMENGEKVFCQDVDNALSHLEGIREAAVIYCDKCLVGVFSPEKGTTMAQIETAVAQYNASQPYYRRIMKLWNYDAPLPYTSSGKLNRVQLEREYIQNTGK